MMCRRAFRPDADYAIARQAVDPASAIRAHEPGVEPPTVGHALKRSPLACGQMECALRQGDSQRKGAARDPLTIGAVARVDQLGGLGDLVADLAALAGTGQRKLHECRQYHRERPADPLPGSVSLHATKQAPSTFTSSGDAAIRIGSSHEGMSVPYRVISSARPNAIAPRRDSLTALVLPIACSTQPNSRNR
jgi:hypothetical protein